MELIYLSLKKTVQDFSSLTLKNVIECYTINGRLETITKKALIKGPLNLKQDYSVKFAYSTVILSLRDIQREGDERAPCCINFLYQEYILHPSIVKMWA